MYKIFAVVALLASANAVPVDHQATSFASFNDNHNSIQHIPSGSFPALAKYAAPAAPVYAAPTVAKVALPVVAKVAIPTASVYQSAPVTKYSAPVYSGSVNKVVAPVVTKYVAPIVKYAPGPAYAAHKEEYAPAQYEFTYAIQDPHTGDFHSQQEHRDGDHVVGQYSLHEADGTVRIVKYSDEGHGFNAIVEREGHPAEAPVYNKVVAVAAPHYQ